MHVKAQPAQSRRVSERVVEALAAYFDAAPETLPSVNEAVDLDALDDLFAPRPNGELRPGGSISFRYQDVTVDVTSEGDVTIRSHQ